MKLGGFPELSLQAPILPPGYLKAWGRSLSSAASRKIKYFQDFDFFGAVVLVFGVVVFSELAAKRRAADDEWGYTPHSGTGHCVHFRGLSEFIEVSELDRKLVNVIWPKYVYYGL